MIVGHYVLRQNMKSKKYKIFLSYANPKRKYTFSKPQKGYRVEIKILKTFHLKIEFKNIGMKNEFLKYRGRYDLIKNDDLNKNYNENNTKEQIESCISHIEPFFWIKYLTIVKLNNNKIGGIFMMEELK